MIETIEITGGVSLAGNVTIGGAKNAALPLLIASLLTADKCEFENVPNLEDVGLTIRLLEHLGADCSLYFSSVSGTAAVQVQTLAATEASFSLVKALRASFWVLAPLLARGRAARVALPGGDIIGARPVDMHLAALTQMGADIKVKHGVVFATAVNGLKPAAINLRFPSVGATHQILMAAALVPGTTTISGAAREPEVVALCDMLVSMGADIEGSGTNEIIVRGKEELSGANVKLIGDRIEAGTYLLAAVATQGSIKVEGINPAFFGAFLPLLQEMGAEIKIGPDWVALTMPARPRAIRAVTGPFPELATDLQAPLMAALCVAEGQSTVEENIFEGRYGHVAELGRMGASIAVVDRVATISGIERLTAAPVEAFDIRAGAALVVAALASDGTSTIHEPQHLRRGYERLEHKLGLLGARVGCRTADSDDFAFSGC